MEDLICRGVLFLFVCLVAFVVYRLFYSRTYSEHEPVTYDARNDEGVIVEVSSVVNQRQSGRERGGEITLVIDSEPRDFDAQLGLKSIRENGGARIIHK